jgi:hypothetical protein
MTKIYKAAKKGHGVLGVLPAYHALYASRGYTIYSYDVKAGEVFREYDVTVGNLWKVEMKPTAQHVGRLDAPQDILFPREAAKAKAGIKDINVGMEKTTSKLGGLLVLMGCLLALWYFLFWNIRRA